MRGGEPIGTKRIGHLLQESDFVRHRAVGPLERGLDVSISNAFVGA